MYFLTPWWTISNINILICKEQKSVGVDRWPIRSFQLTHARCTRFYFIWVWVLNLCRDAFVHAPLRQLLNGHDCLLLVMRSIYEILFTIHGVWREGKCMERHNNSLCVRFSCELKITVNRRYLRDGQIKIKMHSIEWKHTNTTPIFFIRTHVCTIYIFGYNVWRRYCLYEEKVILIKCELLFSIASFPFVFLLLLNSFSANCKRWRVCEEWTQRHGKI